MFISYLANRSTIGSFAIALLGFGKLMFYYDHAFIINLLSTIHDKIILLTGTWRTTRENSATTRV